MVDDLTAEFWQARMKTLMSSIRCKTKREKIDYVCQSERISIVFLMRIFSISYPTAEMIINGLLSQQIIKKVKNGYQIELRAELKVYLDKNL